MGIEPTPPAWKAGVLPLNYARLTAERAQPSQEGSMRWGWQDSNLRRLRHQIYSLAHLATLEHPPESLATTAESTTSRRTAVSFGHTTTATVRFS